ncbi:MAG: phosphoglucosamine mutase [Acidimicrobiia bacterium]
MAERSLFGTDGVRGRANDDLTPGVAFNLARAAGEGIDGPVVIGRDTRRSGPMLASALMAGFNSVGVDTVDLGIIPVGGVSRLTRDTGARFGVMVSASHNPAPDNGIKFFGPDGAKLSDDSEAAIERRYFAGEPWATAGGALIGIQSVMSDAVDRYVDYLVGGSAYSMRGMEFFIDCANGAAFQAAPRVFERIGATITICNADPDGMNINEDCGATHPEHLAGRADGTVGFAFDGDADRLIAVDEDGAAVDGDSIMAILAQALLEGSKLKPQTVVATVMSNLGFRTAMAELGVEVLETRVGDRYVLEEMRSSRAVLGGEQSGHVILEDRATGDGIRTAVRLAGVMAGSGRELRDLRRVMKKYPQILRNIPVRDKNGLEGAQAVWDAVHSAETRLGAHGRVLVRASGTEPLVRVMVEAQTAERAADEAAMIAEVVERILA